MKIFYMIILLIYEIGLIITDNHLRKVEEEIKKGMFRDLRFIIKFIIYLIPIAVCMIGALN